MFDIVDGWSSVQLQDDDYGHRFWTVMPDSEVDGFIAEHRALGYSLDDLDRAMQYQVGLVMARAEWDANHDELDELWYESEMARRSIERAEEVASLKAFLASGPEDFNELMRAQLRLAVLI